MISKKEAAKAGLAILESGFKQDQAREKRIRTLRELLPGIFNDGVVDNAALQEALGMKVPRGHLGYELQFAGKGVARMLADEPTGKELAVENRQSLNADTTDNVMIRGDNLDVLKILYQNYHQKIKMIYIDPPYNTKNEAFIYKDSFSMSKDELAEKLGLSPEVSESLVDIYGTQTHSGWLAFMYPRLKIARELLADDGVIFISIDEHEHANLRIICNEIFGESNFVFDLIRKTKSTTNDSRTGANLQHESCLVYAKKKDLADLRGGKKDLSAYSNPDNDPNGDWIPDNPSARSGKESLRFPITNPKTGKIDHPPEGRYWAFSRKGFEERVSDGRIVFKDSHGPNERGFILKRYKKDLKSRRKTLDSLRFNHNDFMNRAATKELNALGMADYFSYPKGREYIRGLIEHGSSENDLVLDFFAGSGTTGEAVIAINSDTGSKRKFILVQWDEAIKKEAFPAAYEFCENHEFYGPYVSSICIERLKRFGKKIAKSDEGGGAEDRCWLQGLHAGRQAFCG